VVRCWCSGKVTILSEKARTCCVAKQTLKTTCSHAHARTHMYTRARAHTCMHALVHIRIAVIFGWGYDTYEKGAHVRTWMCVRTWRFARSEAELSNHMQPRARTCTRTHTHKKHAHMLTCARWSAHAHTHSCSHAQMYVLMHVRVAVFFAGDKILERRVRT
jgi:hypothetical protein